MGTAVGYTDQYNQEHMISVAGGIVKKEQPPRVTALEKKCIAACKKLAERQQECALDDLLRQMPIVKLFLDECREVFVEYDANGDGKLSLKELEKVAVALSMTKKEGKVKQVYKE